MRGYLNCLRRVMVGCEFYSFSFILGLIKWDSGVSALSPNRQQLTTSTITSNNLNRYSLAQMHYTDSHEIHGTPRGNTVLKYRKVTRPGIEPRTFWTYTRCSNQLSYLALGFNQLILYLCNCQPKDTYSARHIQCHSLHARSTL